jgi:hypothetical protein
MKLWVNGVQVPNTSSPTPSQNYNLTGWNNAGKIQNLGTDTDGNSFPFDGEMAEVRSIDGQALTPNAFGTFNSYGVWQPVAYAGSYGTNGFYLPFTNTANTTALGYDFSPQGNNYTPTNISLTAGSTYDSMTDVPTLTSANVSNYAVLNPLDVTSQGVRNGNLQCYGAGAWGHRRSTIQMTTGSWYWEVTPSFSGGSYIFTGVVTPSASLSQYVGQNANGWGFTTYDGAIINNGSSTAYGSAVASGVVIGVAFDAATGKLYFRNASGWFNSGNPATATNPAVTIGAGSFFAAGSGYDSTDINNFNFGQQPFAYTPPSGFVALNTYNL